MVTEVQVYDGDGIARNGSFRGVWGFKWQVSAEAVSEIVVALQVFIDESGRHYPMITVPVEDHRYRGKPAELEAHVHDICNRILAGLTLDQQTAFRSSLRTFLRRDPL